MLMDFILKADLSKASGDTAAERCCWLVLVSNGIAEDFPNLLLDASAVSRRPPAQADFDGVLQIAHDELGHGHL